VPESIEPVTDFDLNKYMGKWYEIARLDHRFERGLEKVSATYSMNSDGSVRVANRGFSTKSNEWKDAIGKAKFAGDKNIGHLKVSFFGPFYGSYVIFFLDKERYQHAFVTSSENSLWFLSRSPAVSDQLKEKFLRIVKDAGYNTEVLIFVNQK
jgi:apolipoprotein D and lipocalin family protein